ncbi:hypothetical protein [Ancylomarina subtilis]|uniref:hypothetical protein n=1 Tax=Ancylomarina subtilis TaxID=1639035 RepID=UPI00102A2C79|nr:hypothetical protein [Ancylomarina subtilis]
MHQPSSEMLQRDGGRCQPSGGVLQRDGGTLQPTWEPLQGIGGAAKRFSLYLLCCTVVYHN